MSPKGNTNSWAFALEYSLPRDFQKIAQFGHTGCEQIDCIFCSIQTQSFIQEAPCLYLPTLFFINFGHSWFIFIIFVFSVQLTVVLPNFPMTRFEPQISGAGSDRSTNSVANTTHIFLTKIGHVSLFSSFQFS